MDREIVQYDEMTDDQLEQLFNGKHELAVVKQVMIRDLPDGWMKWKLQELVKPDEGYVWLAALVGSVDDWSAYHSPPNVEALSEVGEVRLGGMEGRWLCVSRCNPYKAASVGDKVSESEATAIFPRIAERAKRYRL